LRRFRKANSPRVSILHQLISNFDRHLLLMSQRSFTISPRDAAAATLSSARSTPRVLRHHGLAEEDTELVVWIVRTLLMSNVAQKQDMQPRVLTAFAATGRSTSANDGAYLFPSPTSRYQPKSGIAGRAVARAALQSDPPAAVRRSAAGDTSISSNGKKRRCVCCAIRIPETAHERLWNSRHRLLLRHRRKKSPGTRAPCTTRR